MFVCSLVLTVLLFGDIECRRYYVTTGTAEEQRSTIKEFPALVSLHRILTNLYIYPYCAGTIIHRNMVLTSAHCLYNNKGAVYLRGLFVLSEAENLPDGMVNKAESALIHPNYTYRGAEKSDSDIAILAIQGSFSEKITPMKLSVNDDLFEKKGTRCEVVGWMDYTLEPCKSCYSVDFTEEEELKKTLNPALSFIKYNIQRLNKTRAYPISMEYTKERMNSENWLEVKYYINQTATNVSIADRGGPVICSGVQYGINAWSYQAHNERTVYGLRVSIYKDWIEKSIKKLYLNQKRFADVLIDAKSTVASIYRLNYQKKLVPYCGGTIIRRQIVLTAASCVTDNEGNLDLKGMLLVVGSTDLRFGDTYEVIHGVLHSKYDFKTHTNDIALILAKKPFLNKIVPMKISVNGNITQVMDLDCRIYGWGYRTCKEQSSGTPRDSNKKQSSTFERNNFDCEDRCQLQEAWVNTASPQDCNGILYRIGSKAIQTNGSQFCTHSGIYDGLNGQPGDPIICKGIQYGIVSWGYGCEVSIDHPVVITNVGYHKDWIVNKIIQLEEII